MVGILENFEKSNDVFLLFRNAKFLVKIVNVKLLREEINSVIGS